MRLLYASQSSFGGITICLLTLKGGDIITQTKLCKIQGLFKDLKETFLQSSSYYIIVLPLFGAVYAASNNDKIILY